MNALIAELQFQIQVLSERSSVFAGQIATLKARIAELEKSSSSSSAS